MAKQNKIEAKKRSTSATEGTELGGKVNLSVPWSRGSGGEIQSKGWVGDYPKGEVSEFVKERTRVHELFIREQEKTKRISLILAAVLILSAAALILFAPAGRETLSYWIGAALLVFAAGAAGYKRVWGRTQNMSFGADHSSDKHDV